MNLVVPSLYKTKPYDNGEYWPGPEVLPVRTERSEFRTKTTEGQYSPVRLEQARLVSSLLYGTWAMLVMNLPAFENKKYTANDRLHGKGPYGEILTKKEPIRTLGFTLPYNKLDYFPLRRVISHRVRLSLIFYSSTSQKMSSNTLQFYPLRKHNLDLLCWARYVSICSIYSICQKVSHRFLPIFVSVIEDIVLIEFMK